MKKSTRRALEAAEKATEAAVRTLLLETRCQARCGPGCAVDDTLVVLRNTQKLVRDELHPLTFAGRV